MQSQRMDPRITLLLGDAAVILVMTLAGFARHAEMNAGLRMLTTFIPLLAAWLVVAPWFGQFNQKRPRLADILKTGLAATVAAPLAAVLRGLWLNAPIIPVFALVLAGFSALGLMLWRAVWWAIHRKEAPVG